MKKTPSIFLLATALLGGCKSPGEKSAKTGVVEAAPAQYSDPPPFDAGLSVEQAYAAIPHHRTVWVESQSVVPAEEKAYLKAMFQVLDQAIAVRVASLQNFANGQFDSVDTDAEFEMLIKYVREMAAPRKLAAYDKDILDGLTGERQFFHEWKTARGSFPYAQQIQNHPRVQSASAALKAAYAELMAKYPNENATNKEAFFDYHCALDFL